MRTSAAHICMRGYNRVRIARLLGRGALDLLRLSVKQAVERAEVGGDRVGRGGRDGVLPAVLRRKSHSHRDGAAARCVAGTCPCPGLIARTAQQGAPREDLGGPSSPCQHGMFHQDPRRKVLPAKVLKIRDVSDASEQKVGGWRRAHPVAASRHRRRPLCFMVGLHTRRPEPRHLARPFVLE